MKNFLEFQVSSDILEFFSFLPQPINAIKDIIIKVVL